MTKSKSKLKKIILVGGNVFKQDGPILDFIKLCRKYKIKTFLITEKNQLNYPTQSHESFRQSLKKLKVRYKVLKNFNANINKVLKKENENYEAIMISFNSRWILKKNIIKIKEIYNYHNADLPTQRGAACHSWRIMMNTFKSSLNFHIIENKIDEGAILLKKKINIPKYFMNLSDYYYYLRSYEIVFFENFLRKLIKGNLKPKKQNNNNSYYWPRLLTSKNGFVDWSWSAKEIVSFSNAFDEPFIGISPFLKKKKIVLNGARIVNKDVKFHPYQAGLVYRKIKNKICVATSKGGVSFYTNHNKSVKIKLGDRLYTDFKSLFISRNLNF